MSVLDQTLISYCEANGVNWHSYFNEVSLSPDEKAGFLREGEYGCYFVTEGHVSLEYFEGRIHSTLRICGVGEFVGFGVWIFEDRKPKGEYCVVGLDPAKLLFLTHANYNRFKRDFPVIGDFIEAKLCDLIFQKEERISALESYSVKSRVASMLLSLNRKFGVSTGEGRIIDISVDRGKMASLAGTSPESLSRALTDLEGAKAIRREKRKIVILDEARLDKFRD